MTDFCKHCAEKSGKTATIDVQAEFEKLEEGYIQSGFMCEACGLFLISRQDGKLKVQYVSEENAHSEWEDYTKEKCNSRSEL